MQVWGLRETEEGTGTTGWRPQPLSTPVHPPVHPPVPLSTPVRPICRPPPLPPPCPRPNPEGDTVKVQFLMQEVTFYDNC